MTLAGYLPPAVAEIIADSSKFSAGIGKAESDLGGFSNAVTKVAAAGKMALEGLAIGAAAVGFESVKMAMNFDQQMEQLHTQAGVSQADVDLLKQKVLDLAPAVGIGPEKLAEGLYHIASTGVPAAKQMDILTQASKLAKIGMADLDTVTYAMSGVMSAGMKDVASATDAIEFMNSTVGMGDMRMEQLATAIGTGVLPAFKTAGLGMIDFSAAIATIADNSTPADEAATRLRMTIGLMSAPSKKAMEAMTAIGMGANEAADTIRARDLDFKKYGLTVDQLATDMQQPDGLLVAVQDLKDHLKGLSQPEVNTVLEHMFGGAKTASTIMTLVDESDKLAGKYSTVGDAAKRSNDIQDAWAQQQAQFKQQWDDLVAQIDVYGVKIGNWLIPKIEDAVTWTKNHKDGLKDFADMLSGPVAVALAAYVAKLGIAAALNFAATWEIWLLAFAIGGATYAIFKLNDELNTLGVSWGQFFKITGAMISDWFYNTVGPIYNHLVDFFNLVDKVTGGSGSNLHHLPSPNLPDISGTGIVKGANSGAVTGAGMYPAFAEGGVMPGPIGAPGLAVLHGGETVTPAGGGGGGDSVIHNHLHLDSYQIWQGQLRLSRTKGVAPSGPSGSGALYPTALRQI